MVSKLFLTEQSANFRNQYMSYNISWNLQINPRSDQQPYPLPTYILGYTLVSKNTNKACFISIHLIDLIKCDCFRRINFDAKNQIGVWDYKIEVRPLPESKHEKTFYPDDPKMRHSQSFAGFEIHLTRKPNKYFQNVFLPSGLMVTMSWVRCILKFYWNQKSSYRKVLFHSGLKGL